MNDQQQLSLNDRRLLASEAIRQLGHGEFCANEQMEQWSGYKPGTQEFSFFVSGVRQLLAHHGMWLSGEGQEGAGFFIVRPSENAIVASRFRNKAERALGTMRTLLEHTPLDQLSDPEKRRHQKELRELRFIGRMLDRRQDVVEVLRQHKPGLLKDDIDVEGN